MRQALAGEFDEFVAARWSALLHLARLLTGGDRHRAEDLVQDAFVKLWFVWPKVAHEAPEAYVRKVMVRAAARSARRRWWGERPVDQVPETAVAGDVSA
ncbi:SigE family RNA polymerase sigma factor, partial [Streptomyces sp. SID625]|nr:SigE family RNA polymerase sigma factor [Streptomyces sp. SID625]